MAKVSVVVPTYQRASFLQETVAGLLAQTLADVEIIVVDDGSTDHTPEVMSAFRDPRVQYIRREHLGMPDILNVGFAIARGEYLITCHDHDIYHPTLLEELAGTLDRQPTAVYVHCGIIVVDPSGKRELRRFIRDYPELMPGDVFLVRELLPDLASKVTALTMIRSSALDGPPFDTDYGVCADVELWLRLSTQGDVAYVRKPLICVRERSESSQFYRTSYRLAASVLEAKKLYLGFVGDCSKCKAIKKDWRQQVNHSGFSALLRTLENGYHKEIPSILRFVQEEGTPFGATVLHFLGQMPASLALMLLRSARLLSRTFRALLYLFVISKAADL